MNNHVHCIRLAKSINGRVKKMAVRGELSPLSGLICATVQLAREILHLSGKKSGISETSG